VETRSSEGELRPQGEREEEVARSGVQAARPTKTGKELRRGPRHGLSKSNKKTLAEEGSKPATPVIHMGKSPRSS